MQAAKYFTFVFFGLSVFVIVLFAGYVLVHCYRRICNGPPQPDPADAEVGAQLVAARSLQWPLCSTRSVVHAEVHGKRSWKQPVITVLGFALCCHKAVNSWHVGACLLGLL